MASEPIEMPRRPMEWRRAWRALQALIADPQRTDQVFEITDALAGQSFERAYERFRQHPQGQRLLTERPSLLQTLANREALQALPSGSFGRCYAEFMQAGNLTPEALVEAENVAEQRHTPRPADADRQFYGDRIRDMHDLWHVLTGYGMDEAGEAANLAFSLGQIPTFGIGLIVVAAAVIGPKNLTFYWQRYLFRAWRRGRRAALLTVVPYEELLARPLDDVRRELRIEPVEHTHPDGVLVGNRIGEVTALTATH